MLPGGRLYNSYRGQLTDAGEVALDGLIYAGDAVHDQPGGRAGRGHLAAAGPAAGRLLDEHGRDFTSCSLAFDHWCARTIKPWFDDHVHWDTDLIRAGRARTLTSPGRSLPT